MASESTAALVREILDGRKDLFAELIGAFQSPIYNLALRMTGSPADAADLTQEIFVRAWINLGKYDPRRPFFTWLYSLGINLLRNHFKKKHLPVVDASSLPVELETGSHPAADLEAEEEKAYLQALLLKLSVEQREAILMRFFGGLSFEEMASVLGISQSAAKMRVSRGLERLRALLSQRVGADFIRD